MVPTRNLGNRNEVVAINQGTHEFRDSIRDCWDRVYVDEKYSEGKIRMISELIR